MQFANSRFVITRLILARIVPRTHARIEFRKSSRVEIIQLLVHFQRNSQVFDETVATPSPLAIIRPRMISYVED